MTIGTSVLEIDIRDCSDREIMGHLHYIGGATPGRFVRLHVGATRPPLWSGPLFRPDLTWQFVGSDEQSLAAWEDAARQAEYTRREDRL